MDGESYARAVFRLLLATVRGEYAAAHFHTVASPNIHWEAWISSNSLTTPDERSPGIDKAASGYTWLTAQIHAGKLPRVALSSWALTPEEEWLKSAYYELYMKPYNWRYCAVIFLWHEDIAASNGDCLFAFPQRAAARFHRSRAGATRGTLSGDRTRGKPSDAPGSGPLGVFRAGGSRPGPPAAGCPAWLGSEGEVSKPLGARNLRRLAQWRRRARG